jgi:hypothetical protein
MMPSPSDLRDESFTDDWINKPDEDRHPVLVVPHDDGVLLVIGSIQEKKFLEARQQIELGLELIKRANRRNLNEKITE